MERSSLEHRLLWTNMEERRRTTSIRQLELLIEFLDEHKDLALGRVRSKEARALAHRLWSECAEMLNAEGPVRTSKEWTKVWNDFKCRVRAKLVNINASQQANGDGPISSVKLTPLEERVADIVGKNVGPSPDVQPIEFLQLDRKPVQPKKCWQKIKRLKKEGRSKEIRNRMASDGRQGSQGSPPPPNIHYVSVVEEGVPHPMHEITGTDNSDITFENESQAGTSPASASDVMPLEQINIMTEREQQEELFLLRRSILKLEQEQASENLRHHKEVNAIKEIMESEKLEHQRMLWQIELKLQNRVNL